MSVDSSAVVRRALTAAGRNTRYELSRGGRSGTAQWPYDSKKRCDCSGFVCWALGMRRETTHPLYVAINGGWINTDAMVGDYREPTGLFRPALTIVPGVVLVYPSGRTRRYGHCGIVTRLDAETGTAMVVHCAASNFKRTGDAIQETNDRLFRTPDTVAIWYEGMRRGPASRAAKFG